MKIVLVEDDAFLRQYYTQKLTEKSAVVTAASDGEEGLAKIYQEKPDIILLDLIMPNKDGFEVLEALSKDTTISHIPVLVFSTLGQDPDVQRALQMGAKGYVNKSFYDFDNLFNKILQLAQESAVQQ